MWHLLTCKCKSGQLNLLSSLQADFVFSLIFQLFHYRGLKIEFKLQTMLYHHHFNSIKNVILVQLFLFYYKKVNAKNTPDPIILPFDLFRLN